MYMADIQPHRARGAGRSADFIRVFLSFCAGAGDRREADGRAAGLDVAQGRHPQGGRHPDGQGRHRRHRRVPGLCPPVCVIRFH